MFIRLERAPRFNSSPHSFNMLSQQKEVGLNRDLIPVHCITKQSVCLFLMRDIAAIYFLLVCRSVAWRLSNSIYRLLPQDLRSQSFKPTSPLDLDTTTHIFRSPSTSQITHFHQLASLLAHHLTSSSAHYPTLYSTTVILSHNLARL